MLLCPRCGLDPGPNHRCIIVERPSATIMSSLDRSNAHPDVVSGWRGPFSEKTYLHRDMAKRRAYMREYMRAYMPEYRAGKRRKQNEKS